MTVLDKCCGLSRRIVYGTPANPFLDALSEFNGNAEQSNFGGFGNGITIGGSMIFRGPVKKRYVVILTDGYWVDPIAAIDSAQKCHKQGIDVMALGFGEADEDFLKQIASVEEFASMTDLSGLSGSFSKIAQAIGEGADSGRSIKMI